MMRKLSLAFLFALSLLSPALAQVPPAVPALPDTERRTSYSITASTCSCSVGFQLFGDGTDYQNWVEVFINGTRVNYNDATYGWTITSPSGSLSSLSRPITNAVLTFTSAQTGTVQIVGARRPRRTSQFNESAGVPTRNFNQVLTDIISQNREIWDKTNDVTGRALLSQPGVQIGLLPLPSVCVNGFLGFDGTGSTPVCRSSSGTGNVTLPVASGSPSCFDGTTGLLRDCGAAPYTGVYFAGLFPQVSVVVNLTGLSLTAPLTNPGTPIGDPTKPLIGGYFAVTNNVGNSATRLDNVERYRAAIVGQAAAFANATDTFGMNINMAYDVTAPSNISFVGAELDMNMGNRDCGGSLGGPLYCTGFLITGHGDTGKAFNEAFMVEGTQNLFHHGFVVNCCGTKDVAFFDASNATTSINIGGSHTTGINLGGTFSSQQIAGHGWGVDAVGNIGAASLTASTVVITGYGAVIGAGGAITAGTGAFTTVSATTFTGALTGHASLDLALTGGTMSGSIAMGGNNISGGGTATFTAFSGALTGHASLDLPLTGGTISGALTVNVAGQSNSTIIGPMTGAPSYSTISLNGVTTFTGLAGFYNAGSATDIYTQVPTGGTMHYRVAGADIASLSATGMNVASGLAFSVGASAGLSATKTVRASGGAADCTLIYTGGILTGGTC